MNSDSILHAKGISKIFGGVTALSDVDFSVGKGEIHAIVGENGAGKSTMMKIFAGVYQPDSGELLFDNKKVHFKDPKDAATKGVSIVFQELNLFPELSVYRNIFINRELTKFNLFLDSKKMIDESKKIIETLGSDINPEINVESLTTPERQIVEIARALSQSSRVLIMDEPNSALGEKETNNLFRVLRDLKNKGISIIYISHRLEEVFNIADRVSVFRDGHYIATHRIHEVTIPGIINEMIGKKIENVFPSRTHVTNDSKIVLEVIELSNNKNYFDINFKISEGEIVGIYGLEGCGKDELLKTLFGLESIKSGHIRYRGNQLSLKNPRQALRNKIAMIPPDRRRQGLMIYWSIRDNMTFPILERLRNIFNIINKRKGSEIAMHYVNTLNIDTNDLEKAVDKLSGGNQQKVVIARWLATLPELLIMNDPTRGIDVGTKEEIYHLINKLVLEGMPILLTSSELDEVIGLSDKILIMHKGKLVYQCSKQQVVKDELLHYVNMGGLQ